MNDMVGATFIQVYEHELNMFLCAQSIVWYYPHMVHGPADFLSYKPLEPREEVPRPPPQALMNLMMS